MLKCAHRIFLLHKKRAITKWYQFQSIRNRKVSLHLAKKTGKKERKKVKHPLDLFLQHANHSRANLRTCLVALNPTNITPRHSAQTCQIGILILSFFVTLHFCFLSFDKSNDSGTFCDSSREQRQQPGVKAEVAKRQSGRVLLSTCPCHAIVSFASGQKTLSSWTRAQLILQKQR